MDNAMKDMLLSRGSQLFTTKIAEHSAKFPEKATKLDTLCNYFMSYVTPMENTQWQTFAAIRCAKACIEVSASDLTNSDALIYRAIEVYRNTPVDNHTNDKPDSAFKAMNLELRKEIASNAPKLSKSGAEVIDLVTSFDKSDLTVEGKRARGYLPASFDSTTDNEEESEIDLDDGAKMARVEYDKDYRPVIHCPDCDSINLFLNMGSGTCFDCDSEFEFNVTLADCLSDEEPDDEPLIWTPGMPKRITGQKKYRGIMLEDDDQ